MKKGERSVLLAGICAGLLVCGACLARIAQMPGMAQAAGISGLSAQNLGLGTKKDDVVQRETRTGYYSRVLEQGNHRVGEELPAGSYVISAVQGGCSELTLYEGGERIGTWTLEDDRTDFREGIVLEEGQMLIVTGDRVTAVTEEPVIWEQVTWGGFYESYEFLVQAGSYTAGRDFPAGFCTISVRGLQGGEAAVIESPRPCDGGISAVLQAEEGEWIRYRGVELKEGDVLTIEAEEGIWIEMCVTEP